MNYFKWPINDSNRIGTLQELRSERMDTQVQPKEIDDWLKQSVALVAGCVRGLGTNQRKVRYFAFEGQNDEVTK
jgi:hypothetical protein